MRSWMEEKGWLQGRIIHGNDLNYIRELGYQLGEDAVLIAASQSCDIANTSDPYIEFSVGKILSEVNGNFTFNKNPRRLHLTFEHNIKGEIRSFHTELLAHEKIQIDKDQFPQNIKPNNDFILTTHNMSIYVDWLASRYKRPALPTQFDKRFDEAWLKKKRVKKSELVSKYLIGIYIKLYPDIELVTEPYNVQLLALVIPKLSAEQLKEITDLLDQYVSAMKTAKFNLDDTKAYEVKTEDKVSVATLKQFKRFNLDELSHKHDHPLPTEFHQP